MNDEATGSQPDFIPRKNLPLLSFIIFRNIMNFSEGLNNVACFNSLEKQTENL